MRAATMGGIKTWKGGTGRDIRADTHDRPEALQKDPRILLMVMESWMVVSAYIPTRPCGSRGLG